MSRRFNRKSAPDPGIGIGLESESKRIINPDGSFNVIRLNSTFSVRDAYLFLVRISWWKFLGLLLLSYLVFNILFALLYLSVGVDSLTNFHGSTFVEAFWYAFFFSVQTFTTVGYGATSPNGFAVNIISTIEAMVGLLSFSFATGLLYGRFSRPSERILFSDTPIVSPFKSGNALMFRLMNGRSNVLMNAEISVMLAIKTDKNQTAIREFHTLKLELEQIQYMPLSWTVVHDLNNESPLVSFSTNNTKNIEGELMITLKAFDDTYGQEIYRRHSYLLKDIAWGKKFEPAFYTNETGDIVLDQSLLGKTTDARLNS